MLRRLTCALPSGLPLSVKRWQNYKVFLKPPNKSEGKITLDRIFLLFRGIQAPQQHEFDIQRHSNREFSSF